MVIKTQLTEIIDYVLKVFISNWMSIENWVNKTIKNNTLTMSKVSPKKKKKNECRYD